MWIDVREKLPEQDGWYFVFNVLPVDEKGDIATISGREIKSVTAYPFMVYFENGQWIILTEKKESVPGIVTHWMAPPEPPEVLNFDCNGQTYNFKLGPKKEDNE